MLALRDEQAKGKVVGDYSKGFSNLCKVPIVLASIEGKVINWRDAKPRKEGNALARRCESEGCGFESWRQQRFF